MKQHLVACLFSAFAACACGHNGDTKVADPANEPSAAPNSVPDSNTPPNSTTSPPGTEGASESIPAPADNTPPSSRLETLPDRSNVIALPVLAREKVRE